MNNYKERLANIKAIIMDVDGVLTNGEVFLSPDGSMSRTMHTKDGFAINFALKQGIIIAIITGGSDIQVKARLEYLGVKDVFLSAHNKWENVEEIKAKYHLQNEEIMYLGDDLPDYTSMKRCGIGVAPKDAVNEILEIADYVSPYKGGKGCVREIIEQLLKIQDKWWKEGFSDTKSI